MHKLNRFGKLYTNLTLDEIRKFGVVEGGSGLAGVLDLANLLAAQYAGSFGDADVLHGPLSVSVTSPQTLEGAYIDALDAQAILWAISVGTAAGAHVTRFVVSVYDADSSGSDTTNLDEADGTADGAAKDLYGNAISYDSGTVTQFEPALVLIGERGNRELNANTSQRASKRYRRLHAVVTGTSVTAVLLDANAYVVQRRQPQAVPEAN